MTRDDRLGLLIIVTCLLLLAVSIKVIAYLLVIWLMFSLIRSSFK